MDAERKRRPLRHPRAGAHLYDLLAEAGLEYGPAFQGLTAAWSDGEQIYTEVALPEESAEEAHRFALHPALLDAALHSSRLARLEERGGGGLSLPASWKGVALAALGARALRVRISPAEGDGLALLLADPSGAPLASVAELLDRPLDPAQLQGARRRQEGLLGLEWAEVPLPERDTAPPGVQTLRWETEGDAGAPAAAHSAVKSALETAQRWLADESKADSRLALVTEGAMATRSEESPDPATAAIWGLIRSAQSEHPGRFALIDTDRTEASEQALPAALAIAAAEPQLALREGRALAPRLTRLSAGEAITAIDPERTVLITGATGGLGSLLARHLAERHGARHLLLLSRSGPEAEGAAELGAELEELGAETTIAACDASDRKALRQLLASIPKERPLGAVIHCAGAIADATVETLSAEGVDRVLAPKADAAWHLHELTEEIELSAFVLFSSAAGALGGPGQANYAAANVFLDALAQKRQAEGKPATAIAWGLWERQSGMTSSLGEADLARMRRSGIEALSEERGLELFDAALEADRATALAMPLNSAGLRALASVGALPPIFSGLIRTPKRRSAASGSLAMKLTELSEAEREGHVLELVRGSRAAQPAERDSRAAPGGHRRLRLPQRDRPRRAPAERGERKWRRQADRNQSPGQRGADRDPRHGLPLPGRDRLTHRALAAGRRWPRRHLRVPLRSRLGLGGAL